MGLPKKTKIEFFNDLLEENRIPDIFSSINYLGNKFENSFVSNFQKKPEYYSLRLVPEYFSLQLGETTAYHRKVIKQINWGYSIYLKDVTSIDEYLQSQFKSKYRSIIRRYVNRLEHCFSIKYKLFYGEVDRATYDLIMERLHQMIVSRFGQRQETHKDVHRWKVLVAEAYSKIINKQASLFVIYNQKDPIQISLNYHFDTILFSAISSYDIDYAKFGLGHVEIYKQLQWCIDNNHNVYEMGVGGMDYKRRWSNNIYQYEHHIVYPKNGPMVGLAAKLELFRIRTKEYLKSKKVNEALNALKNRFSKKDRFFEDSTINFHIQDIAPPEITEDFQTIDISAKEHGFLKKPIYDFLYSTMARIDQIKVFRPTKQKNRYVFIGNSSARELILE